MLLALADRCEREEPSRELDGAIYCAVHDLVGLNSLHTDELRNAWGNGEVVVGWFVSPLYTSDMDEARTLLEAHPDVRSAEPMRVCALALRIKAAEG